MNFRKSLKSVVLIAVVLLAVSCVSKKKYVEMQGMKERAEVRITKLIGENQQKETLIDSLYGQFNQMKNELLKNNAHKEGRIDSLSKQVVALRFEGEQKEASLEEKIFAFSYEKRRYNETIKSLKKKNTSLDNKIKSLNSQVKSLNAQLTDSQFEAGKSNDDRIRLTNQLEVKKNELIAARKDKKKCLIEIDSLKKTIAQKDEEISRLNNNVRLLKKELGKK